jgi:hypothetical protein
MTDQEGDAPEDPGTAQVPVVQVSIVGFESITVGLGPSGEYGLFVNGQGPILAFSNHTVFLRFLAHLALQASALSDAARTERRVLAAPPGLRLA